jgi:hypothetical protein
MEQREMKDLVERAIRNARIAWSRAHRGLPSNPMTRTAAIPAVGTLAAAILNRMPMDDEAITQVASDAIAMARDAWVDAGADTPSNPMARTAEKAAIGIVAAGIINHPGLSLANRTEVGQGCLPEER